ncbi:MAG: sensor histidine kinase, partial [Lachnospiraceae bacterium]|nr:sensor histidine kinase [Lachnospiraceae bacterium]
MGITLEQFGFLRKSGIRRQLYTIYILAILVPVMLIGIFLVGNTYQLLTNYYEDLLESDNLRVRTILFEITTQVYNISEELSFNKEIVSILKDEYTAQQDFVDIVNAHAEILDNYMYHYTEIEQIDIYCDNPSIYAYKQYHGVDVQTAEMDWYQRAVTQASVFWQAMERVDDYGNQYWGLCLVRRIPLVNSDYNAILV